jgi:hypothetical protein
LEPLSEEERRKLGTTCEKVDCDKVDVHRGNDGRIRNAVRKAMMFFSGGRSVTLGNHVYLGDDDAQSIPVLSHEVTHVGQYQQWGVLKYYGLGIGARISERLGGDPYSLPNPLPLGVPFINYGMEQQAQIVQNCFASLIGCYVSPYQPPR